MRHRYCFSGGISLGSVNFSKVLWCNPVCESAETGRAQHSEELLFFHLPVTNIAEFENRVDLDEVAHNEPPHLDLLCLPSCL